MGMFDFRARHGLAPTVLGLGICCLGATAGAAELRGVVLDVHTGVPIGDAEVRASFSGAEAVTGPDGTFVIDIGERGSDTLYATVPGLADDAVVRRVDQRPGRPATLRVFDPRTRLDARPGWGAPIAARPIDPAAPMGRPISLRDFLPGGPLAITHPGVLPDAIRVGRRFSDTCAGHEVQRIDTVPLEEYVEGVLLPEIGVFRSVDGGPDSAAEVFKAFAVAARSYALWFYFQDPDSEFHLDDTACNQRYEDDRNAWVAEQVAATRGQVLVQASDESVIDKYEYAASCGRHGTRPEYQDELVPDITGTVACVGSWCGHNNCAAHEVNPEFPDEGRCLVRGVCQWGAVERSMNGQDYMDILAHYQPNLATVSLDSGGPPIDADTGVADAGGGDAGAGDAGSLDAGADDAGRDVASDAATDVGPEDGGRTDTFGVDADPPDADSDAGGLRDADDRTDDEPPLPLFSVVDDDTASGVGCNAARGRPPAVGLVFVLLALSLRRRRA